MIVLQACLRGALVIGLAALITFILRHRSAAARHHVWATAVAVQLALIAFIPLLPVVPLPIVPQAFIVGTPLENAAETAPATEAVTESRNEAAPPPAEAAPTTPAASRVAAPVTSSTDVATPVNWSRVLFYVWLAGVLIILARYLVGSMLMMRVAVKGRRVDDGEWLALAQRIANELAIKRPLTLLWGDSLSVPITWGVLYPMILLPVSAQEWPAERRRFVLVHELAHIKRFDALTQLLAQITLAVFWFSPLVWLAEWRLRIEREHACDDTVLHHGTEPTLYADELLQMVRSLVQRHAPAPAFAALAMARKSEFEGRMLAILDPARRRSVVGIWSIALFTLLSLAIAAPVAAIDPFAVRVATEATPQPPSKPVAAAAAECDLSTTSTSAHVHVDDDQPDATRINVKLTRPGRCVIGEITGAVLLSPNEQGVREMGSDARVRLREITPKVDYAVRIEPNDAGSIEPSFTINGAATGDDPQGRAWIARVLPEIMREAAINAPQRTSRLLKERGLNGSLSEIATLHSAAARTTHYKALIKAQTWNDAQLDRIEKSAVSALKDSPTDAAAIMKALPQERRSKVEPQLLEKILQGMTSDYELRTTLVSLLADADREMLLMLARVAKRLSSGYEKSTFLITAAPDYLKPRDKTLEAAYFAIMSTLESSYERRTALSTAMSYATGNSPVTIAIIKSIAEMSSDSDKAAALMLMVQKGLIKTPAIREAFLGALATFSSDSDRAAVIQSLR